MKLLRITTSEGEKTLYVKAAVRVACARGCSSSRDDAEALWQAHHNTAALVGQLVNMMASRGQLTADDVVALTGFKDVISAEFLDGSDAP